MKYISRVISCTRGMRILVIFIVIVLTIVMLIGIMSLVYINDSLLEYKIVRNNQLKNAYYYARAIVYSDLIDKKIDHTLKDTYFSIKNNPLIESAYTTIVANFIRYKGGIYSLILYDPGLVTAFPGIETLGIKFYGEENECVLSSRAFNDLKIGDTFEAELYFGNETNTLSFRVSSHLVSPYKQLEFGGSGTILIASDLFSNNPGIILQADEVTIDYLEQISDVKYYPDVLFTIKEGVSDSDISIFLESLRTTGTVESLDDIIANTEELIKRSFMRIVIRPTVYLISSLFALFSIIVLMVRKKSLEMAVAYMIGASKKDLVALVVGVCIIITAVPTVVNVAFVLTAPALNWKGSVLGYVIGEEYISSNLVWIVMLYFVLAVLVSVIAMIVSMSDKSPLELLKSLD